jgi:hypothetical protein
MWWFILGLFAGSTFIFLALAPLNRRSWLRGREGGLSDAARLLYVVSHRLRHARRPFAEREPIMQAGDALFAWSSDPERLGPPEVRLTLDRLAVRPSEARSVELELLLLGPLKELTPGAAMVATRLAALVAPRMDALDREIAVLLADRKRLERHVEHLGAALAVRSEALATCEQARVRLSQSAGATVQRLEELQAMVEQLQAGQPDDLRPPEALPCPADPAGQSVVACPDALNPARTRDERDAPLCADAPHCHQVLTREAPGLVRLHAAARGIPSPG